MFHAGIPAYIHDWTWPPDGPGLRTQLMHGWYPWVQEGLGRPNALPDPLPYFPLLAAASAFVPSAGILDALLLVCFAVAFAGAAAYARVVLRLRTGALLAGALYVAGPVLLTKLVAGHLSYVQAFGAFPWLALSLHFAGGSRRWAAAGGLAAAVTVLQPQFFGFDAVYALLALATGAVSLRAIGAVAIFALPLVLPSLLGPTLNAGGAEGSLLHERAVLVWETDQSAPPLQALAGLGYFTHYVERVADPRTLAALWLVPLFALWGALLGGARSASARVLVATAAAGLLFTMGLKGPLGPFEAWAFSHVAPVSLFRELFDAMVLSWFGLALLAALALDRLPRVVVAGGIALIAFALVPPWSRYATYFASPPAAKAIAAVTARSGASGAPPGRVVWLPALQPLGTAGRAQGGTDPLAETPLGNERPLYEYQPDGAFGSALALARSGRWDEAGELLARLGVRDVVMRNGVVSFASGRPERATAPRGPRFSLVASAGGLSAYAVAGARALVTAEPSNAAGDDAPAPSPYRPSRSEAVLGAGRIVAAFPYVWRSPAVGDCGVRSVIGTGSALAAEGGPWILAAPLAGDRCTWLPAATLAEAHDRLYVAAGFAARPDARPDFPTLPLASAEDLVAAPGDVRATLRTSRDGVLVVRSGFDSRWRATIDGRDAGPPREWHGFVAWALSRGTHTVHAWYGGAALMYAAMAFALLGFAAALAGVFLPDGAARRGGERSQERIA